jgi:iron complex transport system permease protein
MSRALILTLALLLACVMAALAMGRYPIPLSALAASMGLGGGPVDPVARMLLWHERLPRVIAAILVGAGLGSAGASFQGVFRNPLVAPDLLGVLAGSGCGAAGAILLGLPVAARMGMTFAGGIVAVALGIAIARLLGGREQDEGGPLLLVFGGIVSGALCTALLSLAKYVADPDNTLPDIVFWLLGSLAQIDGAALWVIGPVLAAGIAVLVACGRFLDLLALSDDEAMSLGVPVAPLRLGVVVLATAVCALTVAIAGTIGWVGLVIPHVARLMTGAAHGRLMPLAAALGAVFLLVADTLARSLIASEIPIGIVTDLVGVAAFLVMLPRLRRGWS